MYIGTYTLSSMKVVLSGRSTLMLKYTIVGHHNMLENIYYHPYLICNALAILSPDTACNEHFYKLLLFFSYSLRTTTFKLSGGNQI